VTEPTEGRAVIRGRVGSLLEVGTGFHPELTGRENIYLNGAILGMTRSEIGGKFDEIASFAEIERFLDTPVKYYSSGMYVRLAFAVAAHLEPEILLVDEVLAVGDAAFQKKCLGKIGNVAQEGRTVLFVSHNMGAVGSICNRCLLIEEGSLTQDGRATEVIGVYQTSLYSTTRDPSDLSSVERYGTGKAKFLSAKVTPMGTNVSSQSYLHPGQDLQVELRIKATAEIVQANVALIIYDAAGYRLIDVNTALQGCFLSLNAGEEARVTFYLEDVLLKPGVYFLGLWIGRKSVEDIDGIRHATSISVEADPQTLKYSETFPGVYQCRYQHHIEKVEA
jgi:lipopolysaccharide transport system ATP-binding protein